MTVSMTLEYNLSYTSTTTTHWYFLVFHNIV